MSLCKFHVTLLMERFPQHKTREQMKKLNIITGLSVDAVYRFPR